MATAKRRHAICEMYRLMTEDLGLDHDTAMHRLFEAAPGVPVEMIVAAQGDMTRTLESLTGQTAPVRPDNGKPNPRVAARLVREAIASGQQPEPAADDFNSMIRQRASRHGGDMGTIDHAELMGTGQSPTSFAEPRQDDFMRARYYDNRARGLGQGHDHGATSRNP